MLVELVEQVNGQKEQSGKVLKKLDGIDERLTRLESVDPPTGEQVSMITLKDHEEKMNEAVAVQTKWFTSLFSLSICNSVFQRRKIAELRDTQMKYRFIKASGFAPNAVQFLEDAYEEGQTIWCIGKKMSASLTPTSNSLPPCNVSRTDRPLERMSHTAFSRLRSAIPRRCRC